MLERSEVLLHQRRVRMRECTNLQNSLEADFELRLLRDDRWSDAHARTNGSQLAKSSYREAESNVKFLSCFLGCGASFTLLQAREQLS